MYLADNADRLLDEFVEFLQIPSISAQESHDPDVLAAAEWVGERASAAGLEHVTFLPTGRHMAVYADWLHTPGKPTLLIYGHFDVQPPDPLEQWVKPPFEPRIEDGRIYARGASDSKGNILEALAGIEALLKTSGTLPVNVKFLAEGQEEIGSPDLTPAISANKELLACDYVINSDGGQHSDSQPSILLGGRGMLVLELHVFGPKADLHSGLFGGAVQNPIHALVQLLDSLHDPDGKVAVDGYYDSVVSAPQAELERIPPTDDSKFAEIAGVDDLFGEPQFSVYERTALRPTLEINGIGGGYQGQGAKTVIPSSAFAKITCRLVANQVPSQIAQLVKQHIARHTPAGVHAELIVPGLEALPFSSAMHSTGNKIAADVLTELYGVEPYYYRTGGSIPILNVFEQVLGRQPVTFGFSQDDEKFHSPNEFLRLASFTRGQRAYCLLLEAFGK